MSEHASPALPQSAVAGDPREDTAALDTRLTEVTDFYEDEVEAAVKALTSIMEPVMITSSAGSSA